MKRDVGKRGLSPVIASVLLILLVIVLAVIIFLWARGFLGERIEKFGQPIEEICSQVRFDASMDSEGNLEILNLGDINIRSLEIKRFDNKGNSDSDQFRTAVDAGEAERQWVDVAMESGSDVDKIVVYPILIGVTGGKNNVFSCKDAGVTVLQGG